MSLTDNEHALSSSIVLPKKRLGILEQKTKTKQCLIRKEYEDFTTYIIYFLHQLASHDYSFSDYKKALTVLYDKHQMSLTDEHFHDEKYFELWISKCDAAEKYVLENIDEIFNKAYKPLNVLNAIPVDVKIDFVNQQVANGSYDLSLLDSLFQTSIKEEQLARVRNSFNNIDMQCSQDFILWQIIKGLLFFTVSQDSHKMIDTKTTNDLMYRFIKKSNNLPDETLMHDFMQIVSFLWF